MANYISVIRESFAWFPLVAFVLTIPYLIQNYHKYGSVLSIRVLIIYSFVLYLMTTYFLVILPLPSRETVAALTGPKAQLVPFGFIQDIIKEYHKTGVRLYRNKALLQFVFNMVMVTPFGMYLHYYFEFDLKKTLKYSFLLSLFFELTQLSGLYFLYPRPYRLFDLDDLLANTLGGVIGYILIIPLQAVLPDRKRIDELSFKRGQSVSSLRRLTALGIDMAIIMTLLMIMAVTSTKLRDLGFDLVVYTILSYFIVLPFITKGYTPGLYYLHLRTVSLKEKTYRYQCALKYLLFFVINIYLPFEIISLSRRYLLDLIPQDYHLYYYGIVFGCYALILMIEGFKMIFNKQILSEKLSKTKVISTIRVTTQP